MYSSLTSSSSTTPMPARVHFVGSVPLESNEAVMKRLATSLGRSLLTIPDGETGPRSQFSNHWKSVFLYTPFLMRPADVESEPELPAAAQRAKPADPSAPLTLGPTNYEPVAFDSYRQFCSLRSAGVIPKDVRFQICLPSPVSLIPRWVADPAFLPAAERAFEARQAETLAVIQDTIPADDLAVQWDAPVEFIMLEGGATPSGRNMMPWFTKEALDSPDGRAGLRGAIVERLVRLGQYVKDGVQLGFHFCYGDIGHKHVVEPRDSEEMAVVAEGVIQGIGRKVDWIHMPVPKNREDEEYFMPLSKAIGTISSENTSLVLGLVHPWDIEGTKRRIEVARKVLKIPAGFGIATECGLGRTDAAELDEVIKVCEQVLESRSP